MKQTLTDKARIDTFLDKEAFIILGGLKVRVMIDDTKVAYGKQRFLVSPVAGEGQVWVETVTIIEEKEQAI